MSRIVERLVKFEEWENKYGESLSKQLNEGKEVVRCRECKHSFLNENHPNKPRICGRTKMCGTTTDDWFCADGERSSE